MNVRDLTPGTRVVLVQNTANHAADHVSPMGVEFLGLVPEGPVVEARGRVDVIRWDDPDWYIADPRTLSAYVLPVDDPDLRGNPPELE